jgi:N-acetylneuraminic acid mutarotase
MYLPKSTYRVKQAMPGEFVREDGTSYTGPYIQSNNGTFYEGNSLNGVLNTIQPVQEDTGTTIERPYNDYLQPTDRDYERGTYTRYFTRDKRNGKFTELGLNQWRGKRNLKYVTAGSFNWLITGPLNDGRIKNIPFKGAATRNKETLLSLEKEFPGISNFFSNLVEFVK